MRIPITQAISSIIEKAKKLTKEVGHALGFGKGSEELSDKRTTESKEAALDKALAEAKEYLENLESQEIDQGAVESRFHSIKNRYQLKWLYLVDQGKYWAIYGQVNPEKTAKTTVRVYRPTAKHRKGGWGTEMDLDDETAQSLLSKAITVPNHRQVYAFHEGKLYEFQPDNVGGYHGYSIEGTEAPIQVLRQLLRNQIITKSEYKKLLKGK